MNQPTIPNDSPLQQNPDVILRRDEPGGPMLFNPDNSVMRILNETGLQVWTLCRQPITFTELSTRFLQEYDNPDRNQVENDLRLYLQEMIKQGFIGILC